MDDGRNDAKVYDGDILFNPPLWEDLVETQRELFRPAALKIISDRLRHEFYRGHAPDRQMPEIDPEAWSTDLLQPYAGQHLGYDLPCLLSADRIARGRIMLCAQDPLRGEGPAKLTVGTFFGIDSHYHRTRRHWGMIWQLVRSLVSTGYDVWVTDAIKVFAGPRTIYMDEKLRNLCYSVMEKEISAFRPDKVVAFGSVAETALRGAKDDIQLVRVPHPTARGIRGTLRERSERYHAAILG